MLHAFPPIESRHPADAAAFVVELRTRLYHLHGARSATPDARGVLMPPPSDQRTRIGRRDDLLAAADADADVLVDALRARCHDALVRDANHELKDALNAIALNAELL